MKEIQENSPSQGPLMELQLQQKMVQGQLTFFDLWQTLDVSVLKNLPVSTRDKMKLIFDGIAEDYTRLHILAIFGEPGAGKKSILTNLLFLLHNYKKLQEDLQEVKEKKWDVLSPIARQKRQDGGGMVYEHEIVPVVFRFTMGILIAKAMGLV